MKKLLIATTNQGKIQMFDKLFQKMNNIEILYLSDFPKIKEPKENGDTLRENAFIKAKFYAEKFDIATLADDTGFSVSELGGAPGVKARRWGGELADNVSDDDWLDFYLDKIKNIDQDILNGAFPFCRCLYVEGQTYYQEGQIDVKLTKTLRKPFTPGFPLSSMAIIDGRHRLDIPDNDPIWETFYQLDALFAIVKKGLFS